MERNFKGIWIPKEIYLNKELSWSEKILFIEIDSLDNEKGCFASNDYFADFIGVSNTRISKMTSKLKEQGLIRQESFDGRQRVLHSIVKYDKADLNKSSKQDDTKVQSRDEQKFKHNNIDNNPLINIKDIVEIRNKYQGTKCKKDADSKLPKLIKQYGKEQLIRGIERYIKFVETERLNGFITLKFKNESTYWNGGYMDYLDENFTTTSTPKRYSDFGEAF